MSDSLPLDGLQHARLLCPSLSPGVCSDSCPLSWWCYLIISSSAALFFFLQSFSASQSFPMSRLFILGRQRYWSFCFSTSPSNEYSGLISFEIDSLISLQSKGLSRVFSNTSSKASILQHSAFFMVQLSHPLMTTGKTTTLEEGMANHSSKLVSRTPWTVSKGKKNCDCSHEIKRRLFLGRKVMTNLDSIFKSRDITLPTKVRLVKATVFPVVMYGCEIWTIKKAECRRIDAVERWYWRRLLRVPWTVRRSN